MKIVAADKPGYGGDVIFQAGNGTPQGDAKAIDGALRFRLANGTDLMVFHPDGQIEVRGAVIAQDLEAVATFKAWLDGATVHFNAIDIRPRKQ